jgi:cytosine/adenosine deaminase-related metal-dependent hydrolase
VAGAICRRRSEMGSILMINRTKFLVAIALSILSLSANAETIALVNGTLINPGPLQIIENATIIIDGDRIAATGDAKTVNVPKDVRVVDCKGKFILPGYIDTHVHFFQSGDLFTRPDGADLNSVRLYKEEIAWVKSHLNDVFALSAQWNHLGG